METHVAKSRQIVLVNILKDDDDDMASNSVLNSIPLGTYEQVVDALRVYNTGPDGSNAPESFGVLFGPGLLIQMPMVGPKDPVMQVAVSMTEEDVAFPVLMRICKRLGWRMMDPSSGRMFGAA